MLLRLNGYYLLIDPALSLHASPLSFVGPRRKTSAPLSIADLPRLDVVLISHNHYDHLDKPTVKAIVRRFILPRWAWRNGAGRGGKEVHQLDWWQQMIIGDLCFDAVPARHWSMRTLRDRNRSLRCGWVVRSAAVRFWFPGDSGYSESLLDIAA